MVITRTCDPGFFILSRFPGLRYPVYVSAVASLATQFKNPQSINRTKLNPLRQEIKIFKRKMDFWKFWNMEESDR